jgi:hypothetical protein|tara:strand:- start:214 stop:399 length:186 start_codon:yes stop_codon:yes gene_type:complete
MTYTYKLITDPILVKMGASDTEASVILRKEDNAFIPKDSENRDYQEYLTWVADGNTPEAAD